MGCRRLVCIIPLLCIVGVAYGDGAASASDSVTVRGFTCTVSATQWYSWYGGDDVGREGFVPTNNSPHETSLYPGDSVAGSIRYSIGEYCDCGIGIDGPEADGRWSEVDSRGPSVVGNAGSGTIHYTQKMRIVASEPVPSSVIHDGFIHTAEYDSDGRARTHQNGIREGGGLTGGAAFTVTGGIEDPLYGCQVATATIRPQFQYRNPFWETSIHEHHILDVQGYPASNLDYSNYHKDAIPLEAGSNLKFAAYRHETIKITHETTGSVKEEFHCDEKTCSMDLSGVGHASDYIGHRAQQLTAKNLPWEEPNAGVAGRLDGGESLFVISARQSGPVQIIATMTNNGQYITKGYNTTYQFVPTYNPVINTTAVTNTAWGGDTAMDRPVSVIVDFNGTISDTLHYCTVGTVHDVDGAPVPLYHTGATDAWGRVAGELCPDKDAPYGVVGVSPSSYIVYPPEPAAFEWGRWSALNPETRAKLDGLAGQYIVCGLDGECTTHDTPYLNWDYAPGTDRDFVPYCVMDQIASQGGAQVNQPKPEDWGMAGFAVRYGDDATPHSYRGIFSGSPHNMPQHYVLDSAQCEHSIGLSRILDRDCGIYRGGECKPEHDRRCEDVFQPFLYPDDYIIRGHERLERMVIQWCGATPTIQCVRESYRIIDEVMTSLCTDLGVVYDAQTPVIDTSEIGSGTTTPYLCHARFSIGMYEPAKNGDVIHDWRECLESDCGVRFSPTPPEPFWDGSNQLVYVPYTPITGAFGGVVERPGNMLTADGSLYCSCTDTDNNNICDVAESGTDLDGNSISDNWDMLTSDGMRKCLDRTGVMFNAVGDCWAKFGRDGGDGLDACLHDAANMQDGPDGHCDPAVIIGTITPDGSVDADGISFDGIGDDTILPFEKVGDYIAIPYVVDGEHRYCDVQEPWCLSAGDTIETHTQYQTCQDPESFDSIKRIPSAATMPPLYQPVFDEYWPPTCLPPYGTIPFTRDTHQTSKDLVYDTPQWPVSSPSHVGIGNTTMMLHAGTGVIRFDVCGTCDVRPTDTVHWNSTIQSWGITHATKMETPPNTIQYGVVARVLAVKPCVQCDVPWEVGGGVELHITAYPEQRLPVTEPHEMIIHECMVDGDEGRSILNIFSLDWGEAIWDFWHGLSCRDRPGVSMTIQDYEGAKHGPAAKREAGQPWTVARGVDDVTVEVFRNGLWLDTLGILEHRGQCTEWLWAPHVTPGHTSCPETVQRMSDCMRDNSIQDCIAHQDERCVNVFTQDGIHKQWEFPAAYDTTGLKPGVVYVYDGTYGRMTDDGIQPIPLDELKWEAADSNRILRCENIENNEIKRVSIQDVDYNDGGSYACQSVQACKKTVTNYKCIGGELVPHVICEEPEESFSILDMPYEAVMSSIGPQKLHISAVCSGGGAPGCNGIPIHDTHVISEGINNTVIYVDYYGVGKMDMGRDNKRSDTIYVRPPETFGAVREVLVDGIKQDIDVPCSTCIVPYEGGGIVTIRNVYGGEMSSEIGAAEPLEISVYDMDEVGGVLWLYMPAIVVGAVLFLAITKYRRVLGIGDD